MRNNNKKTGVGGIMLVMTGAPDKLCQVRVRRIVDWQPLLTHQVEDVMVQGRNIR